MDKVINNKRGLKLVTSRSSGYEISSVKFLSLLCIIWPSLMMEYEAVFELLHLQIYASHFMTSYSTSICPFESGKCEKEGKKSQKFEYLENEKSFLDEIKNIFHSFWRAIIWWEIKIW